MRKKLGTHLHLASNTLKFPGIRLSDLKELYNENFKSQKKEIEENTGRWEDTL